MLGFNALGYGSCPQFSAVGYPDLLRKHIPGSEDFLFICALPIGRPKTGSHVNQFQPPRLPVEEWFKVIG
jgi:nitroreductase